MMRRNNFLREIWRFFDQIARKFLRWSL